MTDIALNSSVSGAAPAQSASRPNLDKGLNPLTMILFGLPAPSSHTLIGRDLPVGKSAVLESVLSIGGAVGSLRGSPDG